MHYDALPLVDVEDFKYEIDHDSNPPKVIDDDFPHTHAFDIDDPLLVANVDAPLLLEEAIEAPRLVDEAVASAGTGAGVGTHAAPRAAARPTRDPEQARRYLSHMPWQPS